MRIDPRSGQPPQTDDWLAAQCRRIDAAGRELASAVGEVNQRMAQSQSGELGRRRLITESHLKQVEAACKTFHDVQLAVQSTLFDCEHELRDLRERDVDPVELLVDGERLIRQYRFLRRRARVIDGLLAYLPAVSAHAASCLEHLHHLRDGGPAGGPIAVADCSFALVALDDLGEADRPR